VGADRAAAGPRLGEFLIFGGQILASDLNGNLLSDGTSGYTWDARNRLTGITGPVTATFQYDGTGRRTRKTINGVTTDFVHDGINPVTESSASGTRLLVTGPGVEVFLMRIGPGSTAMFLTDALGSLVATTDAAGGVQSEVTYEPFGNTEMSSPAPAYRFTGREHDEPLYLYYYRARYYHTDLQRFISEDPIGFDGGDLNLYAYVRNAPLDLTDPLGLEISGGTLGAAAFGGFGPVRPGAANFSGTFSVVAGSTRINDCTTGTGWAASAGTGMTSWKAADQTGGSAYGFALSKARARLFLVECELVRSACWAVRHDDRHRSRSDGAGGQISGWKHNRSQHIAGVGTRVCQAHHQHVRDD